jgi:hypothetical protein
MREISPLTLPRSPAAASRGIPGHPFVECRRHGTLPLRTPGFIRYPSISSFGVIDRRFHKQRRGLLSHILVSLPNVRTVHEIAWIRHKANSHAVPLPEMSKYVCSGQAQFRFQGITNHVPCRRTAICCQLCGGHHCQYGDTKFAWIRTRDTKTESLTIWRGLSQLLKNKSDSGKNRNQRRPSEPLKSREDAEKELWELPSERFVHEP